MLARLRADSARRSCPVRLCDDADAPRFGYRAEKRVRDRRVVGSLVTGSQLIARSRHEA
jgi:hypothetical protein